MPALPSPLWNRWRDRLYHQRCLCGRRGVHGPERRHSYSLLSRLLQGCHRRRCMYWLSFQLGYWRRDWLCCCHCVCGERRIHRLGRRHSYSLLSRLLQGCHRWRCMYWLPFQLGYWRCHWLCCCHCLCGERRIREHRTHGRLGQCQSGIRTVQQRD